MLKTNLNILSKSFRNFLAMPQVHQMSSVYTYHIQKIYSTDLGSNVQLFLKVH